MAIVQIDPVTLISIGGYQVTIFEIDPTSNDCLKGSIVTLGDGLKSANWNLNGVMRDGSDSCNLDCQAEEFLELARLAQAL